MLWILLDLNTQCTDTLLSIHTPSVCAYIVILVLGGTGGVNAKER